MIRARLIFLFFFFASVNVWATHNRAGQITYRFIGQLTPNPVYTYEVTITTFTKTSSVQADRPQLDSVYWGDGTGPQVFVRDSSILLPNDIKKNIYTEVHTYNGNGVYKIHFTDPNRNANVRNIPNSVAVPFYLETELVINPFRGINNSVVTGYDPIDQGCIGRIFVHNPAAFDPDGDSLSYQLVECRGDNGDPIVGYTYPAASVSLTLDNEGFLTWNAPIDPGEYNIAFMIIEWRNGDTIGFVVRDMQILIGNCDNYPPIITVISDTCVLAGDTLTFNVFARDPDFNRVELSKSGAVFDPSLVPFPATFTDSIVNNDTVISKFKWFTQCSHVRPQPYFAQFRARDLPSAGIPSLVDLKGTFITVIAPGPDTLFATPNGSDIDLVWPVPYCTDVLRYNIYRRVGAYPNEIECPCTNGVPANTGYVLIATSDGNDTTYTDDNGGLGLTIGIQYCYIVTAQYSNGSESCASPQSCASLKKDAPVITNADVTATSVTNGSVYVAWSKPTELDTIAFPGPYTYKVFHSPDFTGSNYTQVATFTDLNDTIFIDSLINTKDNPWSYRILFYYTHPVTGSDSLKGRTAPATTVFLRISPTDNQLNLSWEEHVPWTNVRYDIFKQNASLLFDSIASVTTQSFSDTGLINGNSYCYYVRSSGSYSFSGFIDPIINKSQIECAVPVDNVPPCATPLTVLPDCNENLNELRWTNPNNSCSDDVLKYYIYFGESETGNFELIDSVINSNDTVYMHTGLSMISGCYKVTAVDSVGNETVNPQVVCVDTCRQYVLPSVFTPDGDGKNDFFHPCDSTTASDFQEKCPPYKNVKSIDMKIYNRWGNLVFETDDRDINWDGKNKDTNADCSEGVYYYTCKVFFFSTRQEQTAELKGTIQLIRNK